MQNNDFSASISQLNSDLGVPSVSLIADVGLGGLQEHLKFIGGNPFDRLSGLEGGSSRFLGGIGLGIMVLAVADAYNTGGTSLAVKVANRNAISFGVGLGVGRIASGVADVYSGGFASIVTPAVVGISSGAASWFTYQTLEVLGQ
jgi:hypothetical protein